MHGAQSSAEFKKGNWWELQGNEIWHCTLATHSRNAKKHWFWRRFATEMHHTPSGVQKGENRRGNEEIDEGVTAIKELQQTLVP